MKLLDLLDPWFPVQLCWGYDEKPWTKKNQMHRHIGFSKGVGRQKRHKRRFEHEDLILNIAKELIESWGG